MRKIEDLKVALINGNIDKFYCFYGEDFGIRKHYVQKLRTYFDRLQMLNSWKDVKGLVSTKSLFKMHQLIVLYNDMDFCNQSVTNIKSFIDAINIKDFSCLFIYDDVDFQKSNLFSDFADYITEFQAVQSNIAVEFVESELSLLDKSKEELAYNCNNLYNNILLEADKIKNYAQAMGITEQKAFEDLTIKNQLLIKQDEFQSNAFMNSVLVGNYTALAYWCDIVTQYDEYDLFFRSISRMFNDLLIAGLIVKYGVYDGSSRAYNYGLPWGRAKEIREMILPFEYDYYFDSAFKVAEMDGLVKSGKVSRMDIVDYFITNVI